MRVPLTLGILLLLSAAGPVRAEDSITPGELTVDPPTLTCLGFHWPIEGDDDGDGACELRFREVGNEEWRRGMDLWRTNGERCGDPRWTPPVWETPNTFGGSIFDLEPDTKYEVRLELKDPDGVRGDAVRAVIVRTRPEPVPASGGRVFDLHPGDVERVPVHQMADTVSAGPVPDVSGETLHVFPQDADRGRMGEFENARRGLLHAFYGYTAYCDWMWDPDRVEPGDTIVVHAGEYRSNRCDYREKAGYSLWFHGTHFLAESGTPVQPIVIRAAGDGPVVFDGAGCDTLFDVTHADNLVFRGITFRNCRIAVKAGDASRGARGLRLIDCSFEEVDLPLLAANPRCTGYQIAGNTVDGAPSDLLNHEAVVGYRDRLIPDEARPGDIVKLHAGTYKVRRPGDPEDGSWVHGTHAFTRSGTPTEPIVLTAAGDGPVIIDGAGCDTLFDVRAADNIYFEGLTFRNAKIAVKAGIQFLNGASGLTVKRCRFEDIGYGVMGTSGRCRDFYIADNHMRCRQVNRIKDAGNNQTFDREFGYGVNVLGTGHVVCYNEIDAFWDNLNVTTNGHGDPEFGRPAIGIDFYNNVVGRSGDNAGEADGSVRNVRFMRNRCSFSCQPLWGGPVYFIRNLGQPWKFATHPSGAVVYHTRLGSLAARGGKHEFVNNLVEWSWKPMLFNLDVDSVPGRIDGNAYRLLRGGQVERPEKWRLATPQGEVLEEDFDAFRRAVGVERHGFTFERHGDEALVDRAVLLPNVNDGFEGDGPDVGPHERGRPEPHYGPRQQGANNEKH